MIDNYDIWTLLRKLIEIENTQLKELQAIRKELEKLNGGR